MNGVRDAVHDGTQLLTADMLTADTTAATAGCLGNAMSESVAPSNNNNNISESAAVRDERQRQTEPTKQRRGLLKVEHIS